MSSTASSIPGASPILTLELKPSWPVLAFLCGWMLLMAAVIPSAFSPAWPLKTALGCLVLFIGALLLKSQWFGSGARTLRRAVLEPDGQWLLTDSRGGQWTAALSAASRSLAGVVFLSWKGPDRYDWVVLAGSGANRDALRRLRVRLRCGQCC